MKMVALHAQGVVTPATIVTACSAALSPLYNWLLVDYFQVGLAGAALANDAVQVEISRSNKSPFSLPQIQ